MSKEYQNFPPSIVLPEGFFGLPIKYIKFVKMNSSRILLDIMLKAGLRCTYDLIEGAELKPSEVAQSLAPRLFGNIPRPESDIYEQEAINWMVYFILDLFGKKISLDNSSLKFPDQGEERLMSGSYLHIKFFRSLAKRSVALWLQPVEPQLMQAALHEHYGIQHSNSNVENAVSS